MKVYMLSSVPARRRSFLQFALILPKAGTKRQLNLLNHFIESKTSNAGMKFCEHKVSSVNKAPTCLLAMIISEPTNPQKLLDT